MQLTTKTRYGVMAMLDLAIHHDGGPVTLTEVAERQSVSLSYLEQLFARLRKNDLVRGIRGPGGGYTLAREAQDITIAEIVNAIDESFMKSSSSHPQEEKVWRPSQLWRELTRNIHDFLDTITLARLIEEHLLMQMGGSNDSEQVNVNSNNITETRA